MRPKVNFREIPFKSGEYEAECRLRNELLRKPLGLSLWDEDLSVEFEQIHFGFFDDRGELVACAVAQPLNGKEAKVRQVVVKEQDQRVGLGSRLMEEVEKSLKERGFERIALHSRRTVCDFYREQGYQIEGDVFEEVGLLHYRMSKLL